MSGSFASPAVGTVSYTNAPGYNVSPVDLTGQPVAIISQPNPQPSVVIPVAATGSLTQPSGGSLGPSILAEAPNNNLGSLTPSGVVGSVAGTSWGAATGFSPDGIPIGLGAAAALQGLDYLNNLNPSAAVGGMTGLDGAPAPFMPGYNYNVESPGS
jgi:hypothetical protein